MGAMKAALDAARHAISRRPMWSSEREELDNALAAISAAHASDIAAYEARIAAIRASEQLALADNAALLSALRREVMEHRRTLGLPPDGSGPWASELDEAHPGTAILEAKLAAERQYRAACAAAGFESVEVSDD